MWQSSNRYKVSTTGIQNVARNNYKAAECGERNFAYLQGCRMWQLSTRLQGIDKSQATYNAAECGEQSDEQNVATRLWTVANTSCQINGANNCGKLYKMWRMQNYTAEFENGA